MECNQKVAEPADGTEMEVKVVGDILCYSVRKGVKKTVTLQNVQYVPALKCHLISIKCIGKHGYCVTFDAHNNTGTCIVRNKKTGSIRLSGFEDRSGLYEIILCPATRCNAFKATSNDSKYFIWFQRLQHFGFETIRKSVTMVTGFKCDNFVGKVVRLAKSASLRGSIVQ